MAQLTINLADHPDMAQKVPDGYLNATVGITITTIVGGEKKSELITGTLSVIEGVATLKFNEPSALQKLDNAINATNVFMEGIDIIEQSNNGSNDEER